MLYWIGMGVAGLCAAFSFYTAWAILEAGDTRAPWLFVAFGCFFGIPIRIAAVKAAANRIPLCRRIDRALDRGLVGAKQPRPTFVPHWQLTTMLVLALLGLLAALLVPIFAR